MSKAPNPGTKVQPDLPALAYILAFLIGVLLFLIFGEPFFGLKPEPIWIVGLLGMATSAIVLWVWNQIHQKDEKDA
jgi:Na+-driven multidrug efflux pump